MAGLLALTTSTVVCVLGGSVSVGLCGARVYGVLSLTVNASPRCNMTTPILKVATLTTGTRARHTSRRKIVLLLRALPKLPP